MTAEAAAKMDPEEFFRTEDMAMVTYLRIKGHSTQKVEWVGGHTCYWFFRVTDALLDAQEDFLAGEAEVEPRQFSRKYSETKKEFYEAADEVGIVFRSAARR